MYFYTNTSARVTLSSGVFVKSCYSCPMAKPKLTGDSPLIKRWRHVTSRRTPSLHRDLVCDHGKVYGTVTRVPLTKELLNYCATARTRYRAYLDEERKTNEKDEQKLKRRRTEECLDELKKKRKCIEDVCESPKGSRHLSRASGKYGRNQNGNPDCQIQRSAGTSKGEEGGDACHR
ncbi:unnamed protein product [Arctogadus glacialis]